MQILPPHPSRQVCLISSPSLLTFLPGQSPGLSLPCPRRRDSKGRKEFAVGSWWVLDAIGPARPSPQGGGGGSVQGPQEGPCTRHPPGRGFEFYWEHTPPEGGGGAEHRVPGEDLVIRTPNRKLQFYGNMVLCCRFSIGNMVFMVQNHALSP